MTQDKAATSWGSDLIIRLVCLLIKGTDPSRQMKLNVRY